MKLIAWKKGLLVRVAPKAIFLSLLMSIFVVRDVDASSCAAVRGNPEPTHHAAASSTAGTSHLEDSQPVVHHYLFDPVLNQSWAVMIDCRHAERPTWLVPIANSARPPSARLPSATDKSEPSSVSVPWVRGGTEVLLWQTSLDGVARMQLAGVALESAPLGALVDVRIRDSGLLLRGMVRGPGSVEMLGSAKGWRQQ